MYDEWDDEWFEPEEEEEEEEEEPPEEPEDGGTDTWYETPEAWRDAGSPVGDENNRVYIGHGPEEEEGGGGGGGLGGAGLPPGVTTTPTPADTSPYGKYLASGGTAQYHDWLVAESARTATQQAEQQKQETAAARVALQAAGPGALTKYGAGGGLSSAERFALSQVASGNWTLLHASEYVAFQAGLIGFQPGDVGYGNLYEWTEAFKRGEVGWHLPEMPGVGETSGLLSETGVPTTPEQIWKPDFSKADPYADVPLEYVMSVLENYAPTAAHPLPPIPIDKLLEFGIVLDEAQAALIGQRNDEATQQYYLEIDRLRNQQEAAISDIISETLKGGVTPESEALLNQLGFTALEKAMAYDQVLLSDEQLLYKEYRRTGGKLGLDAWRDIGSPLRPELPKTMAEYSIDLQVKLGYSPVPPATSNEERRQRQLAFRDYRQRGGKLAYGQWELMGMPLDVAVKMPSLAERKAVYTEETEKRNTIFKVFGLGLLKLPPQIAAAVLQAFQAQGGADVVSPDWADRFIKDANEDLDKFVAEMEEMYGEQINQTGLPFSISDVAGLPRSMAFSLTSMGGGLLVGLPIALIPVPGARILAWGTGSAASGTIAYSMTTYQIMQSFLEAKNEEMIAERGRGLTEDEQAQLKKEFEGQARAYGLWEAVPEAISNLAFGKLLTTPLSKMPIAKGIVQQIIGKVVGIFGEEMLTETITQRGQANIEIEAGLREGDITWIQAFKEVAPQTFLLTIVLGGAGSIGISSVNRIKASLKEEIGETHPLYDTLEENINENVFDELAQNETPDIKEIEAQIEAIPPAKLAGISYEVTKQEALKAEAKPEVPVTEAGMPEAGYQPSMIEGVTEREVRPKGKGQIVQISMEDQLKLQQVRQAVEQAPAEVREAYEAQAEIEGIKAVHEADPVTQLKFKVGNRSYSIDNIVDVKEKVFAYNDSFTPSQAKAIKPNVVFSEANKLPNGRIRADAVLDELATKYTGGDVNAFIDRVNQIRQEKARIKEAQETIKRQMTEKPIAVRPELTPEEVTENQAIAGKPKYNMEQIDALVGVFADYINQPSTVTAWELTRELRRETMAGRAENLKNRAEELIVQEGITAEEAMKRAISETLAGELPSVTTEYLEGITADMRDAMFAKVAIKLKDEPLEMASTFTALTNALAGRPIPREPGVRGGSAYSRLQRVFGDQTKVLKAIETMASEKKSLKDVVEGIFHETGREPIPIDQKTADYLRDLPLSPRDQIELAEKEGLLSLKEAQNLIDRMSDLKVDDQRTIVEKIIEMRRKGLLEVPPVTPYEAPIDDAVKQITYWPTPARDAVIRVLKEMAWSPVDIGNFVRAMKSSVDMSYWRQIMPLIPGHPIRFALSNVTAWKALFSQKSAEAEWIRITHSSLYAIYDALQAKSGRDFLRPLDLPKGTAQWKGVEEFGYLTKDRAIPRLTAKIPTIKWSNRAFVSGCNSDSWGIFEDFYNLMLRKSEMYASGELTLAEGESFDIISAMDAEATKLADWTGRASLGRVAPAASAISAFVYAPRYAVGRTIGPRHLFSANAYVRKEAWKDAALFVGVIGGLVLLGRQLDWWDVETDVRSADFMKIRIGNLHIDPWGGAQQFAVFYAKVAYIIAAPVTGKPPKAVSTTTGAEYPMDFMRLTENFIESKRAPLAAAILEYVTGKTYGGEKVDVKNLKQWADRIAPMSIQDIWESLIEQPSTTVIAGILSFTGFGVQTYTGDWKENFFKLGMPKYSDNLAYGLADPKYDTKDFWADTASQFKGVDPESLTERKGYPPYIKAIAEARLINEHLSTLPNESLISLNADPAQGTTFGDYYKMWRDRQEIVDSEDEEALKEFDEKYPKAELGNFSQREFALLNEYWTITDKAKQVEFLEEHPELAISKRQDYLRTHPKENAQLAVWGQANLLTKEAYNQFKSMISNLDIPDSAIPEMTLPPEKSIDTHFAYLESVEKTSANSWETQLIKAKDLDYCKWAGLQVPTSPVEALELKIANRQLDESSQGFIDNNRRIDAIENNGMEFKELWVDRGKVIDKFTAGSSEAKVWLLDHKDVWDWALANELLTDDGKDWNEPVLRLTVQMNQLDENSPEYKLLSRKREAYSEGFSQHVDDYVKYYDELSATGYRRDRMMYDANGNLTPFGEKMRDNKGIQITPFNKIPSVRYDDLLEKTDRTPREAWEMEGYLLFIGQEKLVPDYVGYKQLNAKGKPASEDYWFEDDWYWLEHPTLYNAMVKLYKDTNGAEGIKGEDAGHWLRIPTREVYALYLEYDKIVNAHDKLVFRKWHSPLEKWLVSMGYTPVGDRWKPKEPSKPSTPTKKAGEGVPSDLQRQIEEQEARLAAISK